VKLGVVTFRRVAVLATLWTTGVLTFTSASNAQPKTYERTVPQSKAVVEKVLKEMQVFLSGHLPALDGFAIASDRPLARYQRAYYQATVEVSSTASGGSLVRVSAKVTAWYSDPVRSRSGYQLLTSNGRLEVDILDQLSEQLAATTPVRENTGGEIEPSDKTSDSAQAAVYPPTTHLPESPPTFSSSLLQGLAAQEKAASQVSALRPKDPDQTRLQAELEQLEGILKNQVHPKNLAAVKKSGTAVVSTPSLNAKPLFLASAHDEFEILNFNQDWVHVRISGLSRGWIWRNDLEMPDDIPETQAGPASATATDLFRVAREDTAPFPGDWEPLRGKNVKVISVQKTYEAAKNGSPQMKLEFAKSLFDKNYSEIAQKFPNLAGIVVIFDSSDGGMIAAAESTLEKWKAGALSDAALWHNCFFDPPETFLATGPSANQ
jgi:hypothetical protein